MLNDVELIALVNEWTQTALDFLYQTNNFGQAATNMTHVIRDDRAICKADLDATYRIVKKRERLCLEPPFSSDCHALSVLAIAICDAYRDIPTTRK